MRISEFLQILESDNTFVLALRDGVALLTISGLPAIISAKWFNLDFSTKLSGFKHRLGRLWPYQSFCGMFHGMIFEHTLLNKESYSDDDFDRAVSVLEWGIKVRHSIGCSGSWADFVFTILAIFMPG